MASEHTPTMDDIRDYWSWSDSDLGGTDSTDEELAAEFDRALAAHDEWVRAEALKDALPEGAKWFPDEGGIMWQGGVYYPASYVMSRTDIQELRAEERERLMRDYEVESLRQQLAERDALVESQARQIAALTGSVQDISTRWGKTLDQLAERDAVIAKATARYLAEAPARGHLNTVNSGRIASDLQGILAASPSAVLAEHDARVQAEVLEELSDLIEPFSGIGLANGATRGEVAKWLRKRAAEYRKGAGQ